MINENFKKDLVVMIGFSSLEGCHTGVGGNALMEKNFLNLLPDKILQYVVKTFVFKRFYNPIFEGNHLDIMSCSTLIRKN